jgi:hypothetical protein
VTRLEGHTSYSTITADQFSHSPVWLQSLPFSALALQRVTSSVRSVQPSAIQTLPLKSETDLLEKTKPLCIMLHNKYIASNLSRALSLVYFLFPFPGNSCSFKLETSYPQAFILHCFLHLSASVSASFLLGTTEVIRYELA